MNVRRLNATMPRKCRDIVHRPINRAGEPRCVRYERLASRVLRRLNVAHPVMSEHQVHDAPRFYGSFIL